MPLRRALRPSTVAALALILSGTAVLAGADAATEQLWLSGKGRRDTVDWEFRCETHRRCASWTTIPVPSQWELVGMGHYAYGHDPSPVRDVGHYRTDFTPPPHWRGWLVDLVFEGVMTDAEVRLNSVALGEHHGGFYRFRFPVEDALVAGARNRLEVTVREHSASGSVNRAERQADYWTFGGIYRPVRLEARPPESIAGVALDARHDGRLAARVRLTGLTAPATLVAEIRDRLDRPVSTDLRIDVEPDARPGRSGPRGRHETEVLLTHRIAGVRPWSAEDPVLYHLRLRLLRDGRSLHRHRERFGFRTVELRAGAGLFVNDRRVLLKGVNRHAFWPASGRTLDAEIDRGDVELIRSMNMNAVRTSHYPPDPTLLEACDELGLYVLDELAGWHDAYSTFAGRKLAREMVQRDRNHPSVLAWVNGNEGGSNDTLDVVIRRHDPQFRPVLHADALRSGVLSRHYPTWRELHDLLQTPERFSLARLLRPRPPLVLPTESLHGLYDGGSAAGLEELWALVRASPRALGLFLWALFDEAVVRIDHGGRLDTDGNHAPDGIVGPFREPTAHVDAVRAVFSPIVVRDGRPGTGFDGRLVLENRFDTTDLAACRFSYRFIEMPSPLAHDAVWRTLGEGELDGPPVAPGSTGELAIPPVPPAADALELTAFGPGGGALGRWVFPRFERGERVRAFMERSAPGEDADLEVISEDGALRLRSAEAALRFELDRGTVHFEDSGASLELTPLAGEGAPFSVRHQRDGTGYLVEMRSPGPMRRLDWRFAPSTGWARLSFHYDAPGDDGAWGPAFALSAEVQAMEWLGAGPGRVWGNRLAGPTLGLWHKLHASPRPPSGSALEPVLPGYYAGVDWARLVTDRGALTLVVESDDLYLRVLRPSFPDDARDATAAIPAGDLAFEARVPPIGTKFHPAAELAPPAAGNEESARRPVEGVVWLRFETGG
jgi:hypothetical protein